MTKSQIWWRIIQEETWNVWNAFSNATTTKKSCPSFYQRGSTFILVLILKVFSFGGYFEVKMILNVCCWGRSSGRFTLSKISCPLWRASKISHLKFYVLRHVANLLNECKITMDTIFKPWIEYKFWKNHKDNRGCWSILMVVTAFVFRQRGQPKLPGPGPLLRTSGPFCPVLTPGLRAWPSILAAALHSARF